MDFVFEIVDKSGRVIHLTKERLKHIQKHPFMQEPNDNLKLTLKNPSTVRYDEKDENVVYFYKEFKEMDSSERYLLVSVNI